MPPTPGAVWPCVGVFAGTAVVWRLLGNEAFTVDAWVVLALVLGCTRYTEKERVRVGHQVVYV